MGKIKEIINSEAKPKEKVVAAVNVIFNQPDTIKELLEILETGTDVQKGNCADIMKNVTIDTPEIVFPYIETLIDFINYKAPRVKWGIPESIGNIAKKDHTKVDKAIPFLFRNTIQNKDNSTVIRWCSAYALSEIAKASRDLELLSRLEEAAKKEPNNGVKNVYLKAIREVQKKIDELKMNT